MIYQHYNPRDRNIQPIIGSAENSFRMLLLASLLVVGRRSDTFEIKYEAWNNSNIMELEHSLISTRKMNVWIKILQEKWGHYPTLAIPSPINPEIYGTKISIFTTQLSASDP